MTQAKKIQTEFVKIGSMNILFIGYFMKVGSQAKFMSKDNSIVKVKR